MLIDKIIRKKKKQLEKSKQHLKINNLKFLVYFAIELEFNLVS